MNIRVDIEDTTLDLSFTNISVTLENRIEQNETDIETLQADVLSNDSDISSLQTAVSTNTGDISDLQTDVATNTADIAIKEPLLPDEPTVSSNKFLTFDDEGNKIWKEIAVGTGGFAPNLYPSNTDSDVSGYKTLSYSNDTSETEVPKTLTNTTVLVEEYLYPDAVGVTAIPEGRWTVGFTNKVSASTKESYFELQFFARQDDDTEYNLFDAVTSSEINHTDYEQCTCEFVQPQIAINATDRLGVKVYAKTTGTNITISYKIGGTNASYFTTPSELRHDLTRDKNGNPDYQHVTTTDIANWNDKSHTSLTNLNDDVDNQHIITTEHDNLNNLLDSRAFADLLAPLLAVQGDVVVSRCLLPIRMLAGLMDFSITNADNLKWYFPDGTTSTATRPAKTLSSAGVVYAVCDDFSDSGIEIKDNVTNANYAGTTKDITYFTYYASFSSTSLSGDVADIKTTYYASFYNTLVSGDVADIKVAGIAYFGNTAVTGNVADIKATNTANFYNTAVTGYLTTNIPTTIDFSYTNISTADIDTTLINMAASTKDNGSFTATGMTRTSASDAAVATLTGRGWTISGITKV